tara:strand:+ start:661 stop:999 length:339 start_codon:yes stop_codon:yes gene_type:complete
MRVKIAYGVNLEELPEKIEELGHKALIDLTKSITNLTNALETMQELNEEYNSSLHLIEEARLTLSQADSIMGDLQNILQGLHNYYNGEQNVSKGRSTMDSGRDSTEPPPYSG